MTVPMSAWAARVEPAKAKRPKNGTKRNFFIFSFFSFFLSFFYFKNWFYLLRGKLYRKVCYVLLKIIMKSFRNSFFNLILTLNSLSTCSCSLVSFLLNDGDSLKPFRIYTFVGSDEKLNHSRKAKKTLKRLMRT